MSTAQDNQVTLDEALQIAQHHHQAGNLMVAEQTYRDILNAVPDHEAATEWLAIILYETGKKDEALVLFKKCTALAPRSAQSWSNYAVVLAENNEIEDSIKAFEKSVKLDSSISETFSNFSNALWLAKDYKRGAEMAQKALDINPDNPDAHLNLGNAYQAQEKYDDAIKCWKKAVKLNKNYYKALNNIGHALRETGKPAEGEDYCRKAIEIMPQFHEAWNNLGNALFDQGNVTEAEEAFRQATHFKPDYAQAQNNLAIALLAQARFAEAAAAARYAVTFKPDYADAYSTLSIAARELGDLMEAEKHARKALDLKPDNAERHLDLADILLLNDRLEDANRVVEKALELSPDTPRAYVKLSSIKELMGDPDAALEFIEKGLADNPEFLELHIRRAQIHHVNNELPAALAAIDEAEKLAPDNINVLSTKSDILQSQGDMKQGGEYIRKAIEINPDIPSLYFGLSKYKKFTKDDPDFAKMKELAKHEDKIGLFQACVLNYGLYSAYENTNQYKKAFASLKKANDYRRKITPYNPDLAAQQFQNIKNTHKKGFAKPYIGKGYKSDIPVFIVGMPRSGTTLTEQIISSHPDVYGAGELPHFSRIMKQHKNEMTPENAAEIGREYVEAVTALDTTGKALRITDKMPGNFARMGEIMRALPDAKIIHCRRNPIDTSLSCYKQNFARGQYWSYNLEELAMEYRRYADLMAHWRNVLPEGSFIEIDYEDTVADLESQARKLIEYVELPWDEACLMPHKNKRAVLTASKAQVIKPVYKSSVKAWKRYEKQLEPLIEGLGDLVPQKKKKTAPAKKSAAKKPAAKKKTTTKKK